MPGEAQDEILPFMKVKAALAHCEQEPIGCAFGLTKDKKECVLMVDKLAKPKKVASMIKAAGKTLLDMQTIRFGRVEVDVANDPGTLKFTINRAEAGGTVVTLSKVARHAGYTGIVINPDEGLEAESEEGAAAPVAPPAPPAAAPPPDPAALKARLTALVKAVADRVPKDPANRERLSSLAKTANIQLGTNNLKTAAELMDGLDKLLATPLPQAPVNGAGEQTGAGQTPSKAAFRSEWEKSFGLFRDAIETVDGQMAALGSACRKVGDPWLANIADLGLPAVTGNFKTPLMAACMDISRAADGDIPAAAARARKAIGNFATHIASDAQVAACDSNPFGVPVSIRGTLVPALKSLNEALHHAA